MTLKHQRNEDGSHHVEIHALKVLLIEDGDHWVAQGLDLDYAAAGSTIADAKHRFSQGLCHTIGEHLAKYESIEKLIRPAPREVWQLFYRLEQSLETSVQELPSSPGGPIVGAFSRLAFLQPVATTA